LTQNQNVNYVSCVSEISSGEAEGADQKTRSENVTHKRKYLQPDSKKQRDLSERLGCNDSLFLCQVDGKMDGLSLNLIREINGIREHVSRKAIRVQ